MLRTEERHPIYKSAGFSRTIRRSHDAGWGMVDTLESVGSVVTHLSTMGTTIVKGA